MTAETFAIKEERIKNLANNINKEKAKHPFKRVYCTTDDEGDWFVLPYNLKDEFNKELNELINSDYDSELTNEFEFKYSEYRTGGSLDLKELYIKS